SNPCRTSALPRCEKSDRPSVYEGRPVTLRARLTAAFLAVVLGPVLLGAVFVGVTVTAVNRARAVERLDRADGAVRGALDALCAQLRADATAAAVASDATASAGVA